MAKAFKGCPAKGLRNSVGNPCNSMCIHNSGVAARPAAR
jgi:hypothetical protein